MNSKETIKKIISETNPNLDISEGSGITDILINPLSSVLEYYEGLLNDVLDALTLKDPVNMSEDRLDAIAANNLIQRVAGTASTGTVKFYFESPITVTIPSGAIFKTEKDVQFKTLKEYSITAGQMANNIVGSYYTTGPINITSLYTGEDQQVGAGEINRYDEAAFSFVKLSNSSPTSISSARESNEDLYNRIMQSATSDTALSQTSIEKILRGSYSFKSLTVKGLGDTEMARGISYAGTSTYDKVTSDFFGKKSAIEVAPHNANFAGSVVASGEEPPEIGTISLNEFSDTNYEGLYLLGDSLKSESLSANILNEGFDTETLSSTWFTSDSNIGLDQLKESEEITVSGNTIKLGIGEVTKPNINVTLSRTELESLQSNITSVIQQLNNYILKVIETTEEPS